MTQTTTPNTSMPTIRHLLEAMDTTDRTIVRQITLAQANTDIAARLHTIIGYVSEDLVKNHIKTVRRALAIPARSDGRVRIAVLAVTSEFVPYSDIPYLAGTRPAATLATTERTVLRRIVAGERTRAIATALGMSESSVKHHMKQISHAYGVPAGHALRIRLAVTSLYHTRRTPS